MNSDHCGSVCEYAGHEWADAGGGLLMCLVCETEKWADTTGGLIDVPDYRGGGLMGRRAAPDQIQPDTEDR